MADRIREWFEREGVKLDPVELKAALKLHGVSNETVVDYCDEHADRRKNLEERGPQVDHPGSREINGPSRSQRQVTAEAPPRPSNVIALRPEPDGAPVPPQNLEAEESVLGAAMISRNAIDACAEVLSSNGREFYRESHAKVWRAILALTERSEPVDAITLANELDGKGELENIGGRVRLSELATLVPASANAAHYARIVKENAAYRGLIRAGGEIARLGWDRPGEAAELIDRAQQTTLELADNESSSLTEHVEGAVKHTFKRMTEMYESGKEIVGLASGFREIDRLTAGFEDGNLIIVAARPSMGKSALVHAICGNVAKAGGSVALFSPEMSKVELVQRLLSKEAHVDLHRVRTGRLAPDDWSRMTTAANTVQSMPVYLNDAGALSLATIRAETRRLKQRHGLALVAVDYLQLMSSEGENRTQEVSKLSRGLKVLARDLNVPVIALSQLSRAVEQRADKRPVLSDLRESGTIEQDADLVIFIYRDEYYHPDSTDKPGIAEVNLAKHRNGPTDSVELAFKKAEATFTDLHHTGVF